jgi:hypothetical protein
MEHRQRMLCFLHHRVAQATTESLVQASVWARREG